MDFAPLAFTNGDGTTVVVIATARTGVFSIQGLPAGTYGIKFTTPTQFDVDLANQTLSSGDALVTGIPRDGVITICAV